VCVDAPQPMARLCSVARIPFEELVAILTSVTSKNPADALARSSDCAANFNPSNQSSRRELKHRSKIDNKESAPARYARSFATSISRSRSFSKRRAPKRAGRDRSRSVTCNGAATTVSTTNASRSCKFWKISKTKMRCLFHIFAAKPKSLKEARAGEHAADDALKFYTEREWPESDVIVGNPPFLGGKFLRRELGDAYVEELFSLYGKRVEPQADLCCYWFEKGREQIAEKHCDRAGLLATQGIRGGANRKTLQRIKESGDIFFAESDRPWILDGAGQTGCLLSRIGETLCGL